MMKKLKPMSQGILMVLKPFKLLKHKYLNTSVIAIILLSSTGTSAALNGKISYRNVPKPPVSAPSATSNLRSSFGGAYQLQPPQREQSYQRPHHQPPHHQRPHHPRPPHHSYPPSYPHSHPNAGITVIYQQSLPSSSQYQYVNQGHVYNGNSGISQSTVIVDWHQYHLPAPARGMHWIYEHGRYLQVPNR